MCGAVALRHNPFDKLHLKILTAMNVVKYICHLIVYVVSGLLAIVVSSCEQEIDFEYHVIEPLHVIEATIGQHGAEVIITTTTPMSQPMDHSRITDASVLITDLTDGADYRLIVGSDGAFRCDLDGLTGHEYRLEASVGENRYEATTRMLAPTEIVKAQLQWIRMPGDDMAALTVAMTDNEITSDYYWIRIYRNGEAYTWDVINDHASVDGILETVITTTHRDVSDENDNQILLDGDVVGVSVTAIDRKMFDYLIALGNGSNGDAQFTGGCLGYLLASPVATASVVFRPDEIEYAE